MAYGNLNFDVNKGASFEFSFTWLFPADPDDKKSEYTNPQNLTDWSGEMVCSGLAGFPLALTLGGEAGTIEGLILDTTTWEAGSYDYQIKMTAPDSTIDIILVGKICVAHVPLF